MTTSKLDAMYRSLLITKFFTKGWGKPENLRRLFEFRKVVSNRDECFKLVERDYPVTITKEQNLNDCRLLEGYFTSPLERWLPGIVPEVAQKAHFQVLMPVHWPDPGVKPMCLHLAGTGDHFFWRRRNLMVKPLIKEAGIGGIILENPFYGLRKPIDQIRSSLHNVSDIFVMGGCLILESLVLFHWCERNGLGPLGVTGLSMGGHMASLAATNWPKPLVLVPCLSWSTASAVFLQGVMAHSINWDLLEDQYLSDGQYREKLSKMVTVVDEAFLAGKKFAQSCTENFDTVLPPIKTPKESANKVETAHVTNKIEKKVDITYNENKDRPNQKNSENHAINVEKATLESNKATQYVTNEDSVTQLRKLNEELKRLLEEGKISSSLYSKLTSNEKFILDAEDIDDINKMTEEHVKEVLLKCKVADLRQVIKQKQLTQDEPLHEMTNQLFTNKENAVLHSQIIEIDKSSQTINPSLNVSTITSDTSSIQSKDNGVSSTNRTINHNLKDILEESNDSKKVDIKSEKKSWSVAELTSDLWTNLPFRRSKSERKIDIGKIHWRDREALQFMRGIMDECTHLSNFSVPFDTSLIIAVFAKLDAYVPRDDVGTLEEIWPGAEVRYVDAGHVSAYILHQSLFRACIIEAFERSKKKWKDGNHVD